MTTMKNGSIVTVPEVFAPEHLPSELLGRERELEELLRCLAPAAQNRRPSHAWLCGRTGTGKTATVKTALARHTAEHRTRHVYVNCIDANTCYGVLDYILTELRVLRAETPQTAYKARRLKEVLQGRPLVVVIDEIDRMPPDEREAVLHFLTEVEGVGLVCLSEKRDALASLKASTVNRVGPMILELDPYDPGQLLEILAGRAEAGLEAGCWNRATLEKIAAMSGGDARVAVQTLRAAANLAEAERLGYIEGRHVERGFERTQELRREYRLRKLTAHHRLIYDIVRERRKTSMRAAMAEYRARCEERGLTPVARRSFYRYVEVMRRMRLLKSEKARAFGSVMSLEAVE